MERRGQTGAGPGVADIASPCTGVCRIEEATGLCLGCKRTLGEIADWPMLSPREKRALLEVLAARQA